MSDEIVLNLNLPEYQDNFLGEGEEDSGLWQQSANKKLVELLKDMGTEAQKYKSGHEKINGTKIKKLNSYHHAIFISGGRGTGKTVFLRNAEAVWNAYAKKTETPPNLHFIDVLDPTLLSVTDRFSEVIIASVYAATDKALAKPNIDQRKKNTFFNAMTTLAGALGKSSEFDELRGIDRIQKYRSGIQLEQYFHQFLIASVDLLGCDAIVLPIDDVDMKIDNAFAVLDDIRCLLSCPLVLPLVSGDDDLYRHIATMKFEEALTSNRASVSNIPSSNRASDSNTPSSNRASDSNTQSINALQLSNAYLTKVFPQHTRLPLLQINRLLPYLRIQYGEYKTESVLYSEYIELFRQTFYPLCNQPEKRENGSQDRTAWLQPRSARQLVQQIKTLPPDYILSADNNPDIWERLKALAEANKNGITVANAESYLHILAATAENQLTLSQLISFNPILQKKHYQWGKYDFLATQRSFELRTPNNNEPETNSDEISEQLASDTKNKIICNMPPREILSSRLFISQIIAERSAPVEKRIELMVYTHNEVYNDQQNRRYHVLFSRAFEILFWSMLYVTKNIDQRFNFKKILTNTCLNPPFYSKFSFTLSDFIAEYTPPAKSNEDNADATFKDEIEMLYQKIQRWTDENKQLLTSLNGKNLIPLLNDVFYEVFRQTRKLDTGSKTNSEKNRLSLFGNTNESTKEYLSDLAHRFKYVFMNSLAVYAKQGSVVRTDNAIRSRNETIRDIKLFFGANTTISRNYQDILDLSKLPKIVLNEEASNDIGYLLYVMWQHPLFQLPNDTTYNVGPIDRETLDAIRNGNNIPQPPIVISSMSIKDIHKYYLSASGNDTIKTKEVRDWAEIWKEDALKILNRIEELSLKNPKIAEWINGTGYTARLYNGISHVLNAKSKD